ncbi:MAG: prepilin-type N-terminal cleavage/methylation domain-containing protein [Phycisphaeraceae bacterium]|nr:prepilin-type N-terminal cleavage/methylation domain-containing protein [Phycisphaeraceae bacterium]
MADRVGKHGLDMKFNCSTIRDHRLPAASRRGLSLVETLIALAITAMLLTATMVATDASFRAYADSCEQASAQAGTRMITNRLLMLVRTSTAHGPLLPDGAHSPPVTLNGNTITSNYLELIDPSGNEITIEYRSASSELWLITIPAGSTTAQEQPLIGGVTACTFYALRKEDNDGLLVLDRATMDLTVRPGADATLPLENGNVSDIRIIASTKPRKVD